MLVYVDKYIKHLYNIKYHNEEFYMSISYTAIVAVGLYRKDIVNQSLFDDELEAFGTHYDGNAEDYAIAGLAYAETESYAASELMWDENALVLLHKQFFDITGQHGKVWLLPSGH